MYKLLKKSFHILFTEGASAFLAKVLRKIIFVYNRITFHPYIKVLPLGDEKIIFLISSLFAKEIYDNKDNIEKWSELYWVRDNQLVTGDLAVDCGSNTGYTSLFFSQCVGKNGSVYCFEPQPDNAKAAIVNIKMNNCKNVTIENVALGAKKGIVNFIDVPNGSVGVLEDTKSIKVQMTTLDDYFSKIHPNFLKIDVEGYEIEVLKGGKRILSENPKLDIEIHCAAYQNRESGVAELLSLINISKYDIYLQLERNSSVCYYDHKKITPKLISEHDNIHLFAIPIKSVLREEGL